MRIQQVTTNENSFKGLHLDKFSKRHVGSEKFLKYDTIKKYADKYEVLIKGEKNIEKPLKPFLGISAGLIVFVCIIPALPALLSLGIAAGAGFLTSMTLAKFGMGVDLGEKFTIQIGKNIKKNLIGEKYLSGIKSDKIIWEDETSCAERGITYISSIPDYQIIENGEDIERQEMDIFSEIMSKYDDKTLFNIDDIYNILKDKRIKKNFKEGNCFNLPIDNKGNTLLTKFFDIVPANGNEKKYDAVINIMKTMPDINYNQKDSNGISILEKILNSENEKALLDLIKACYMDPNHIDIRIAQENMRHEQEISRLDKSRNQENEMHKRKINDLKKQKERIKQIQSETLDEVIVKTR